MLENSCLLNEFKMEIMRKTCSFFLKVIQIKMYALYNTGSDFITGYIINTQLSVKHTRSLRRDIVTININQLKVLSISYQLSWLSSQARSVFSIVLQLTNAVTCVFEVSLSVLFLSASAQANEEAGTVDPDLGKTMEASRTDDETLQK